MAFRALAFHHSDWRNFELCVHKPQFLQFLRWPIYVINSVDNTKLPFLAWFKVAYSYSPYQTSIFLFSTLPKCILSTYLKNIES